MRTVAEVIHKLPNKFQSEAAQGLTAVFQFQIDDQDCYYLEIAQQHCEANTGEHPDPDVTLIMDTETFMDAVSYTHLTLPTTSRV